MRFAVIVVALLGLGACQAAPRSGTFKRRALNGQVLERGNYRDGKLQGDWASYYSDGTPHARGHYVAGLRDGVWREWHENGKLWLEGAYRDGKRAGPWVEYDFTGTKSFEGSYANDRLDGAWRSYSFGGGERASGRSVDGKLEGVVVMRTDEGMRIETTWKANKLEGPTTVYDAAGAVVRVVQYRGGLEVKQP